MKILFGKRVNLLDLKNRNKLAMDLYGNVNSQLHLRANLTKGPGDEVVGFHVWFWPIIYLPLQNRFNAIV